MRYAKILLGVALTAATSLFAATRADSAKWVGVWHGDLDGQPGVVLTLVEDAGELSGTAVFNVVIKENGQARVAGSSVHAVKHPQLGPETLEFHVTRKSDGRDLDMLVRMIGEDKAELQCQDCGPDKPIVTELVRAK